MGYAIMITDKIKTMGTMTSKYNHNERIAEMTHIIPELTYLNEELVSLPKENGCRNWICKSMGRQDQRSALLSKTRCKKKCCTWI